MDRVSYQDALYESLGVTLHERTSGGDTDRSVERIGVGQGGRWLFLDEKYPAEERELILADLSAAIRQANPGRVDEAWFNLRRIDERVSKAVFDPVATKAAIQRVLAEAHHG